MPTHAPTKFLVRSWFQAVDLGDLSRMKSLLAENSRLTQALDPNQKTALSAFLSKKEPSNHHHHDTEAIIRLLLRAGADVHTPDVNGWMAIHTAAIYQKSIGAKLLLQHDFELLNQRSPKNQLTPLMLAALSSSPTMLAFFVEKGANLELKNLGGMTALHLAAQNSRSENLTLLLQAGANVNVLNDKNERAEDSKGLFPSARLILKAWREKTELAQTTTHLETWSPARANPRL